MIGRPILKKHSRLQVLIDTEAYNKLLLKGDQNVKTILKYSSSEPFDFIRSPSETSVNELAKIPSFTKRYDSNGNIEAIEFKHSILGFNHKINSIEVIGRKLNNGMLLNKSDNEALFLVFVQSVLIRYCDESIFITDNIFIIKNRQWLESRIPGNPLNIVTSEEAKEIMDLFAKYQGIYHISGNYKCNKGLWYKLYLLTKIPNFSSEDSILNAFFSRFIFLLMSSDEIGYQYYSKINNDSLDNTMYHFNYSVTLITGIFDSLAIRTSNQYNLRYKGKYMKPNNISLKPKTGRIFLNALEEKNEHLRKHIDKHVHFIKLIYQLREQIIHREMLSSLVFQSLRKNERWKTHFVEIDQSIAKSLCFCDDTILLNKPFTKWGVYKSHKNMHLIPFYFVKSAINTLSLFSNQYLELLGFNNFAQEKPVSGFTKTIELFKRDKLAY